MPHDLPAETSSQRETCAVVLAHLSDPHLPPPPVRWWEALNKRALSLISWKKHRQHVHLAATCAEIVQDIARANVDAILVSGDLTNFGFFGKIRYFSSVLLCLRQKIKIYQQFLL